MKALEKWLFPYQCVLTGKSTASLDLDLAVLSHLTQLQEVCPVCATPTPQNKVCGICLAQVPNFDRTQVSYPFVEPIRQLIIDYKFHNQLYLSRLLAELWLAKADVSKVDALVPVPLHPNRLLERGFNQSLELAKVISKETGLPILNHSLLRIRDTPKQALLTRSERLKNVRGAFSLEKEAFKDLRRIAIIDDVITTGTTMELISALIKRQTDVAYIEAWAIAKTLA